MKEPIRTIGAHPIRRQTLSYRAATDGPRDAQGRLQGPGLAGITWPGMPGLAVYGAQCRPVDQLTELLIPAPGVGRITCLGMVLPLHSAGLAAYWTRRSKGGRS